MRLQFGYEQTATIFNELCAIVRCRTTLAGQRFDFIISKHQGVQDWWTRSTIGAFFLASLAAGIDVRKEQTPAFYQRRDGQHHIDPLLQEALIIRLVLAGSRKHGRAVQHINTGIAPTQALSVNIMAQIFHLQRPLFAGLVAADQSAKHRDHR